MQSVLFINGCVRGKNSRTLKIARTYLETLAANEDINLTERNLMQDNLHFLSEDDFDPATGEPKPFDTFYAQEFARADQIIIAAPYWEFLFPAVVSCYLERTSVAGITFRYTEQGSEGLCKATLLTYIYSAGAYLVPEDKICEDYLKRLSSLYGIPEFSVIRAEGLDVDPALADVIVDEVCRKVRDGSAVS